MRWLIATLVTAGIASWALAESQAQPAPPTFAYLFGRVTVEGENVSPEAQPVLAFVNGKSCGEAATTFVATEGEDVPDDDVGSTVYVIDVLGDGTHNYEREGCGHPGDPITIYLPTIGRMASARPLFQAGPTRADVELDILLAFRAGVPQLASDASN
jgi:hypothetical protein